MSHIIIKAYFVSDVSVKYYNKIICLWFTNFKLYYIHINNKYIHTIIELLMSYVNHPDHPRTIISPDNRSSTVLKY